jgi:glycosyltransferase involved in cell wall biosynthesis
MANNTPLVTVIILSYNHGTFISEAIRSVFLQDYPSIELIISDDCSTDNSAAVINDTIKEISSRSGIKIKTRFGDQNLGVIRNLNEALKLSSSEYIYFLSSDDCFKPFRISKTIPYFEKYDIDVIACDATVIDKTNNILSNSMYFPDRSSQEASLSPDITIYKNLPVKTAANFVKGGFGLSFNKRILAPYNGLFPEGISHEDDFISFLGLVNKGVLFTSENLIYYRRAVDNLSGSGYTEDINEWGKYYSTVIERQNTILKEKENYILYHEISNIFFKKNKMKLLRAIKFKYIRNQIVINYCRDGLYKERIHYSFSLFSLYHGSLNVIKYFLIGVVPFLTKKYIHSQRARLKEIFIV